MADKLQAKISLAHIVEQAADSDGGRVTNVLHSEIPKLGGNMTYNIIAEDRIYYAPNTIATTTSNELLVNTSDNTTLTGAKTTYTNGDSIDGSADHVKYIFIRNTGTSDTDGTTTTNSVYYCFSTNTETAGDEYQFTTEIPANEFAFFRLRDYVANSHVSTAQTNGAGSALTINGSTKVRCEVFAICTNS